MEFLCKFISIEVFSMEWWNRTLPKESASPKTCGEIHKLYDSDTSTDQNWVHVN